MDHSFDGPLNTLSGKHEVTVGGNGNGRVPVVHSFFQQTSYTERWYASHRADLHRRRHRRGQHLKRLHRQFDRRRHLHHA